MTFASISFALVALLGAVLYLAIPASRLKALLTGFYVLFSLIMFGGSFEILGDPKPVELEWHNIRHLPIVGLYWDEESRKTYVWVLRDGVPKSYVRKWSENTKKVEEEQDQWRRREQGGTEFYTTDDAEADVERAPKLPPKGDQK